MKGSSPKEFIDYTKTYVLPKKKGEDERLNKIKEIKKARKIIKEKAAQEKEELRLEIEKQRNFGKRKRKGW